MMPHLSYSNTFHPLMLRCLAAGMLLTMHYVLLVAQQNPASISESWMNLKTYGFNDPDPSPILISNPGIYPYHTFDGYSSVGRDSSWKVVKLENQYIEVYVLPQVGGKVWGAIEKSTGEEFIYKNEVMKFRNISMRGPWTSGGIEFNFGIIGHHPSTATPVDYKLHENQDGSVSCTVGNIDLPSRTQWRVEVLLAPDKAYFETRVVWYNPTSSTQSYYNWMTGAALASEDLTFYCPGNGYLDHPGGIHSWPIDEEGRDISKYANNDFGGSKSYHVVGVHDDFFGGYYSDRDFGFGHWSPYESMPGQKLWLWALSRSGGIWEDLLTDTDGQYIEFQAGRLLNQFSPGGKATPITKVGFEPGSTDIWREIWFPVKAIGGLTSVSTKGVLHVIEGPDSLQLGLNALSQSVGSVLVYDGDDLVFEGAIQMEPMDVEYFTVPMPKQTYTIEVPGMDIQYLSDVSGALSRPYETKQDVGDAAPSSSADQVFRQAQQQMRIRKYELATKAVLQCLQTDPFHLQGLALYADLLYRRGEYAEARKEIEKALSIDTYAAESNFVAGKIYLKLDQIPDALEAYGWAARSMEFRAAGYALMAEIYLKEGEIQNAVNYARNALDFNRFHIGARYVLTIAARMVGNISAADRQIQTLLAIDPLNHFALMEQYFLGRTAADSMAVLEAHRSEMPYQTFLELAVLYHRFGQDGDALQVLEMAPSQPIIQLWQAFLHDERDAQKSSKYLQSALEKDVTFVFPYRLESLPVLKWAIQQDEHWKLQYYYALNLWAVGHQEEASRQMIDIGQEADRPSFYRTRAHLLSAVEVDAFQDLQHALEMDKSDWRSWMSLIKHYDGQDDMESMLTTSREAYERLPNNYTIGMAHLKALIGNAHFEESLDILGGLQVLPFEGARAGRSLWEQGHIGAALDQIENGNIEQALPTLIESKKWPEHLGVGKPYQPDESLADYLIGYCYGIKGEHSKKRSVWKELQKDQAADQKEARDLIVDKVTVSLKKLSSSTGEDGLMRQVGPWSIALKEGNYSEIQKFEATHPVVAAEIEYQLLKRSLLLGMNE